GQTITENPGVAVFTLTGGRVPGSRDLCEPDPKRFCQSNHPLLSDDPSPEAAVVAKGPLPRRCMANSLRISSILPISLEPVFTSSMSSTFPLRASCAFVSNWITDAPMARLIAYPMAQANKVARPMMPIRMMVLSDANSSCRVFGTVTTSCHGQSMLDVWPTATK